MASIVGVLAGGALAIYVLGPLRDGKPDLPKWIELGIIGVLILGGSIVAAACALRLDSKS